MQLLCMVTAVLQPDPAHLAAAIEGVRVQKLPPGWDWQWVVQQDGTGPSLESWFAGDERIRFGRNGRRLGVAGTRNLALARVSGELVRTVDADDVLLPGALAAALPHFQEPGIAWAVGQADDLHPDGTRTPFASALPFGRVRAGVVNRLAAGHGGNWPVHGAGLTVRTTALRALGGWAGVPNDEDLVMLAALSEMSDGYNDPVVTWLYRQHPGQVTRTAALRAVSPTTRLIALQRAEAVRASRLAFGGRADWAGSDGTVPRVGTAAKSPASGRTVPSDAGSGQR